jgi:23S rRNA pseudouridine2605 synthase
MAEAVGHPVVRLVRTRIGPLTDSSLTPGAHRRLTLEEVRGLAAAATPAVPGSAPAQPGRPTG